MNLTPMCELLDWFKEQNAPSKEELELKIVELMEKERSVIIESVNDTINVFVAAGFKTINAEAKTDLGEVYYNEKFKPSDYEQSF
jgi:hypothetical protein